MKYIKEKEDPCEWRDYFCWLPKIIKWTDTEFSLAWLETIERKKTYSWYESFWVYRFKEKTTNNKQGER